MRQKPLGHMAMKDDQGLLACPFQRKELHWDAKFFSGEPEDHSFGLDLHIDSRIRVVDHTCRMRIFFAATPIDDTPPLSQPNEHSLEAGWFSIEEMAELDLRPLSLLTFEGAPWPNL